MYFSRIYQLNDAEREQLDARGIGVVAGPVARLVIHDDHLSGVELSGGRVVERSAVFVRPGIRPHPDGLLAGVGCEIGENGFVVTDATPC
ncbi:MAG TPA: hypothetical protein PLV93_13940 [Microthrixaceae bacterium]|nr:NAD(P)/FAD-dependent oxidoreductase [Microthrixaceae bacterium]HNI36498.1 hypothetical protein [Microthrixaceae bacterium]